MIRATRDGHHVIREAFNTRRHNGVRADHHTHVGALEERVQVVSAKVHHIILLLGIAHEVVLEAILVLVLMRIRPQ